MPGSLPRKMFSYIYRTVQQDWTTLEYGSGLSTLLFNEIGCAHLALEDQKVWRDKVTSLVGNTCEVKHVPLTRVQGSRHRMKYDWLPVGEYNLVLIDGPQGKLGRDGVLEQIQLLVNPQTIVLIDDVHRREEKRILDKLCGILEREARLVEEPLVTRPQQNRAFAILEPICDS